ncbi:MAG: LysE family translocator [Gammaproteobacteria bacterium]|nr:LysE family translocator [Gammaproteobacteria bacterium]
MYFDSYLWVYIPAVLLLTISPGVDTLMVIRNSLRGGWRDGVLTSFAICCGLFVHALISAGGISLVLMQSAWLFGMLKLAGAAYLIWLGVVSLRSALRGGGLLLPKSVRQVEKLHPLVPLREGFLSNVLNPKAVVFYMAFLPQFIQPSDPVIMKALFLTAIHFVLANLWQIAIVLIVINVRSWLDSPSVKRYLDGLAGSVMITLGAKIGLES